MTQEQHKCCKRIETGWFTDKACIRTAKVERNGKWYCLTHDPERRKEKRQIREKIKYDAVKQRNNERINQAILIIGDGIAQFQTAQTITQRLVASGLIHLEWIPPEYR